MLRCGQGDHRLNLPLIMVLSGTGHSAVSTARYSPKAPIIAISAGECSIKQLQCVRVMRPFVMFPRRHLLVEHEAKWQGKTMGILMSGDCVVAVHGQRKGYAMAPVGGCTRCTTYCLAGTGSLKPQLRQVS